MENTNQNKKEAGKKSSSLRQSFSSRTFKNGSYSLGITILVLIVLVVANLLVKALPAGITSVDLSPSLIYTIGDTTREYLSGLDKDVDILVVAESGSVDERITNFLNSYADLSSHVRIDTVDPVLHPEVLEEYDVSSDNLVVSCEATGRTTNIAFRDIIITSYNQYYNQYYESSFDGEGQLTSAIDYVTSDTTHQLYQLTGHNEAQLGSALADLIKKSNITINTLDLMADKEIPEDCELLIINGAATDLNQDEAKMILSYLAAGGNVTIALNSPLEVLPNLESILNEYGLQSETGYASDTSRYYTNSFEIFPMVADTDTISSLDANTYILLSKSGIISHIDGVRKSISIQDILTTSSNGYRYVDQDNIVGPDTFVLAAQATETVGDATANLLVFASSSMLNASIMDNYSNVGNASAYMDCIEGQLTNLNHISIPAKSIEVTANTVTNGLAWGILFMAVIPVVLLASGFVIWFRRRRR